MVNLLQVQPLKKKKDRQLSRINYKEMQKTLTVRQWPVIRSTLEADPGGQPELHIKFLPARDELVFVNGQVASVVIQFPVLMPRSPRESPLPRHSSADSH